ncbi:MAG: 4-(cytidine 5'-diphospho)-2-C-methyl-D-erythritol kinase [Proteobacteria bacterium]|nr:4-(cytidine 5'-diphospho)-2-C-methyl-D-erythritol kinase [Pseudomonadota bacterium]
MADQSVPISVFAPAKINLYLDVLGRRADGHHDVLSLIVFCDIGDRVGVAAADDLTLHVSGPFAAALGPDNIVMRAARQLLAMEAPGAGAKIELRKCLPVAAGMGGGSSDAAATLKSLCALWGIDQAAKSVAKIAAELGADVAACLAARPVVVSGVGDRIIAEPRLPALALTLINPGVPVSTAEVYRRCVPPKRAEAQEDVAACALPVGAEIIPWLGSRNNDLTEAAVALAPEIAPVLAFLEAQPNCLLARMSGSGATCFGVFEDGNGAREVARRAAKNPDWWVRAANSLAAGSP